jgi:hypothetical protein
MQFSDVLVLNFDHFGESSIYDSCDDRFFQIRFFFGNHWNFTPVSVRWPLPTVGPQSFLAYFNMIDIFSS